METLDFMLVPAPPLRTVSKNAPHAAVCALMLVACGEDAGPSEPVFDAGDGMADAAAEAATSADAALPDANAQGGYAWELPKGFPRPSEPADNPTTAEKVALGRFLFYDERLSQNDSFSCATCHKQELAFTDGRATGLGSTGEAHPRGSMSLANIAYSPTLTWANPLETTLEHQARTPLYGAKPIELGMPSPAELEARLRDIPGYAPLFAAAFPNEAQPVHETNVLRALAAFQRTLISGNAPIDRYLAGDESAIGESAKRGHALFNAERLECFHCHGQFTFASQSVHVGQAFDAKPQFFQTGLYNVDGRGGYPEPNRGVFEISGDTGDMGKFKAPTLRNIALTAPYMHDGSIATLEDVLTHYARGGRAHSFKTDGLLIGFELDPQERADLLAFFETLTDQDFVTNPKFSDPGAVP
jgi:cytochrome c peroxidase